MSTPSMCTTEDAIAIYKVALEKVVQDFRVPKTTIHKLDNCAEVKRMEHDHLVRDMQQ